MPIYKYLCRRCLKTIEEFRHIDNRDEVPFCCNGYFTERMITAPIVQGDIDGYQSIAVDKETGKRPYINSRKQHREFLLRNDYIELGTQEFKPIERAPQSTNNISFDMDDL